MLLAPSAASGQVETFAPTRFDDQNRTQGCLPTDCSLREAATEAQSANGAVVINLRPGTYQLSLGQLTLYGATTINGAGARATTIRGDNASRVVFLQETVDATINDVTITNGNATGPNSPDGGGIYVQNPSTLQLNRSAVVGNRADSGGAGIYDESGNLVRIADSTIAANTVTGTAGAGAGIAFDTNSRGQILNSTISGNEITGVRPVGGVALAALGELEVMHVTISGNSATASNLLISQGQGQTPALNIWNTVVTADNGPACAMNRSNGGAHNLDDDGTCGFSKAGDKPGVDPLLGPLQNNGGATDTRALSAGSPAIDGADAFHCINPDQRGVLRPQLGACDMGAFEYVLPPPPEDPPQGGQELPPPVAGRNVNALPKSGTVRVKLPRRKKFRRLTEGEQLPVGTTFDTRNGHVTLIAAANKQGGTSTAEFWAGIFKLSQTKKARPLTTLKLIEKLRCKTAKKATIAAKRKKKRRLWGNGSGRFRTDGQYSSATVRGTKWLVEDRCTSTLTRVVRGRVAVRDKVKRKTVVVRAKKRYVAKRKP